MNRKKREKVITELIAFIKKHELEPADVIQVLEIVKLSVFSVRHNQLIGKLSELSMKEILKNIKE